MSISQPQRKSNHTERLHAAVSEYEAGKLSVAEIRQRNHIGPELYPAVDAAGVRRRKGKYILSGEYSGLGDVVQGQPETAAVCDLSAPQVKGPLATRITHAREHLPIGGLLRGNRIVERLKIAPNFYEYRTRGTVAYG